MKRTGIHEPSVETLLELSGIEHIHPGGLALTERTAEVAGLRPGMQVLDVSSGRGTLACFYAQRFGVDVTGIDLSEEMVRTATETARLAGVSDRVRFRQADSQRLPFEDAHFDAVINECAVGIPEDSDAVLREMVRVARPGAAIVIHENTWTADVPAAEKRELSERFGGTPLTREEWLEMLERAGARELQSDVETWSRQDVFWDVRRGRTARSASEVLTCSERARALLRATRRYGPRALVKAFRNERVFVRAVQGGKLGYGLYWGRVPDGGERSATTTG